MPTAAAANLTERLRALGVGVQVPQGAPRVGALADVDRTIVDAIAAGVRPELRAGTALAAFVARFPLVNMIRTGQLAVAQFGSRSAEACDSFFKRAEEFGAPQELRSTIARALGLDLHRRPRRTSRPFPVRGGAGNTDDPFEGLIPTADRLRLVVAPSIWPTVYERLVRRGDLRSSILATLEFDLCGEKPSEAQLNRRLPVARGSLRQALDALLVEGRVAIAPNEHDPRELQISLVSSSDRSVEVPTRSGAPPSAASEAR